LKVAVTDLACVITTIQEPVPVQAPLQPAKIKPAADEAVRVTVVPESNGYEQCTPQSIPNGLLTTLPLPTLVSVNVCTAVNVAVQVLLRSRVTEPSEQSALPLQPEKTEPSFGEAVRVMSVPEA
jgi:hypothetical protein